VAELTQDGRTIGIETPLGKDVLLLLTLEGNEAISDTFSCRLQLISNQMNIPAKDVIGKKVDIWLQNQDNTKRYINGYVKRFSAGPMKSDGYRNYRAEVVPWLWFLNKTSDCKIFQNKTAPQVIEEIFSTFSIADFLLNITREHHILDYCVQYCESQLEFISRLCREHGLFYFFVHKQGKHTLILTDNVIAYENCDEFEVVQSSGGEVFDHINTWDQDYEFISGKWTQTDFNYETPHTNLSSSANSIIDLPDIENYEKFLYPGGYHNTEDARTQTDLCMMEEEAGYDIVQASSNYRSFFPGGKFKLIKHDFEDELGKTFVITQLHIHASEGSYFSGSTGSTLYENSFTAIPDNIQYFSSEKCQKPIMFGPQTAIVVGPEGEKIYTDEHGRVKVQFHWDRHGQSNETSSCWLRVSQTWAGKGWGAMALPHVGQEVIVSFLEGDPDRPIVTGRVYNGENEPAITANENKDKNIIRDDYGNEIVLDATPDDEHIRIYSPHHQSGIELGKSIKSFCENDSDSFFGGNKRSVLLGTQSDFFGGAKSEGVIGVKTDVAIGFQFDVSLGPVYKFSAGGTVENSWGPKVITCDEDILFKSQKDNIIAAGDEVSLVGNCEEVKGSKSKSIMILDGEKIKLSLGDNVERKENKLDPHNEWYKKKNKIKAKGDKISTIAVPGAALVSVASLMVASEIAASKTSSDDSTLKWVAAGIWYTDALAAFVLTCLLAIQKYKLKNQDSAIEPVLHKDPDMDIELHKEDGISVRTAATPIIISNKEELLKLIHEYEGKKMHLEFKEGNVQMGDSLMNAYLKIDKSETITIDNSMGEQDGNIKVRSKKDIDLIAGDGAGDVWIKSKSFNAGNFKVLA